MLNELLQNADDAGSKYFRVCLDKRTNAFGTSSLLGPSMAEFQGPALYQYDDASFKPEDFESIQKVGDGLKRGDPTKTGQFGLGFNSCYHITDLPQFMSGKYCVCFDPHMKYLPTLKGASTGSFFDMTAPVATHRSVTDAGLGLHADVYPDQFRPFEGMFGCDARGNWIDPKLWDHTKTQVEIATAGSGDGTLFRFPLRSKAIALSSDIKRNSQYSTVVQQIREVENEVLLPFLKDASRKLLFLKSVEVIEVYVWEPGASGMTQLLKAELDQVTTEVRKQRLASATLLKALMSTEQPFVISSNNSDPNSSIGNRSNSSASSLSFFGTISRKSPVSKSSRGLNTNSTADDGKLPEDDDGTSLGRLASKLSRYQEALKNLQNNMSASLVASARPIFPLRIRSRVLLSIDSAAATNVKDPTTRIIAKGKVDENIYITTVEQYVVSSCFGDKLDLEFASRDDVISQGLCLVPQASVALLVGKGTGNTVVALQPINQQSSGDWSGVVFCCLPTSMRSGLPVLVDGRWELTRDRNHFAGYISSSTSTRNDASTLRTEWNLRIARLAGAAYARLLHALSVPQLPRLIQQHPAPGVVITGEGYQDLSIASTLLNEFEGLLRPEYYYSFFPDVGKVNNSHPVWYECVKSVYELLCDAQAPQWRWFSVGSAVEPESEIRFLHPINRQSLLLPSLGCTAAVATGAAISVINEGSWMGANSAYFIGRTTVPANINGNATCSVDTMAAPKLVLECLLRHNSNAALRATRTCSRLGSGIAATVSDNLANMCPLTDAPLFVLDAMLVYSVQSKGLLSPANLRDWLRTHSLVLTPDAAMTRPVSASCENPLEGIITIPHVVACLEYVLSDLRRGSGGGAANMLESMMGVQLLCVETAESRDVNSTGNETLQKQPWFLLPFGGDSDSDNDNGTGPPVLDWSPTGHGFGYLLLKHAGSGQKTDGSGAASTDIGNLIPRLVQFVEPSVASILWRYRQELQLNVFSPTLLYTAVLSKVPMDFLIIRTISSEVANGPCGVSDDRTSKPQFSFAAQDDGRLINRQWLQVFWGFIHAYITRGLDGSDQQADLVGISRCYDTFPIIPCADGSLKPLGNCGRIMYDDLSGNGNISDGSRGNVTNGVRRALLSLGVSFIDPEFYCHNSNSNATVGTASMANVFTGLFHRSDATPSSTTVSGYGGGVRALELLGEQYRILAFSPRDVLQVLFDTYERQRRLSLLDYDVLLEYFALHSSSLTDNDIFSKLIFLPIFQTEEGYGRMQEAQEAAVRETSSIDEFGKSVSSGDNSMFYTPLRQLPDTNVTTPGAIRTAEAHNSVTSVGVPSLFTLPEFEDETGVTFSVPNMPMAHFVHRPTSCSSSSSPSSSSSYPLDMFSGAQSSSAPTRAYDVLFSRLGIKPLSRVEFYVKYVLPPEYWQSISVLQRMLYLSDMRSNYYNMRDVSITTTGLLHDSICKFGHFIATLPIIWTHDEDSSTSDSSANISTRGPLSVVDSVASAVTKKSESTVSTVDGGPPKRKSLFGGLFKKKSSTSITVGSDGVSIRGGSSLQTVVSRPAWVSVSQLLDPREPLLQQFFLTRLPPKELRSEDWLTFLQLLGLQSSVTKEQVLECARLVSDEYVATVTAGPPTPVHKQDGSVLQNIVLRARAVTTYLFANYSSLVRIQHNTAYKSHHEDTGMTESQWLKALSSLYIAEVWKEPLLPAGVDVVTGSYMGGGLTQFKDCVLPIGSSSNSFSSSISASSGGYSRTYCCCWSSRTIVRSFGCYVPAACIAGLGVQTHASLEDVVNHLLFLCHLSSEKLEQVCVHGRGDRHIGDLEGQLNYIYDLLGLWVHGNGRSESDIGSASSNNYFELIRRSFIGVPCILLCDEAAASDSDRYRFVRGDQIYREMRREIPPLAYGMSQLAGYLQDYYHRSSVGFRLGASSISAHSHPLFDALGIEVAPSISKLLSWNKHLCESSQIFTTHGHGSGPGSRRGLRLEGEKLSDMLYVLTLLASEITRTVISQSGSGSSLSPPVSLSADERRQWLEHNIYCHLIIPDTNGLLCHVRSNGNNGTIGAADIVLIDDGSWLDGKIDRTKLHIAHQGLSVDDAIELGIYRLSNLVEERCGSIVPLDATALSQARMQIAGMEDALKVVARWHDNICSPYFSVAVRRSIQHCRKPKAGSGGGNVEANDSPCLNERIYRLKRIQFEFASVIQCRYVVIFPPAAAYGSNFVSITDAVVVDVTNPDNVTSAAVMFQDGVTDESCFETRLQNSQSTPTVHLLVPAAICSGNAMSGEATVNESSLLYWRRRWLPNLCIQLSRYIAGSGSGPGARALDEADANAAIASQLRNVLSELLACESARYDMMDVLDAWQIPYSKTDAANCSLGQEVNVIIQLVCNAGDESMVNAAAAGVGVTDTVYVVKRPSSDSLGPGSYTPSFGTGSPNEALFALRKCAAPDLSAGTLVLTADTGTVGGLTSFVVGESLHFKQGRIESISAGYVKPASAPAVATKKSLSLFGRNKSTATSSDRMNVRTSEGPTTVLVALTPDVLTQEMTVDNLWILDSNAHLLDKIFTFENMNSDSRNIMESATSGKAEIGHDRVPGGHIGRYGGRFDEAEDDKDDDDAEYHPGFHPLISHNAGADMALTTTDAVGQSDSVYDEIYRLNPVLLDSLGDNLELLLRECGSDAESSSAVMASLALLSHSTAVGGGISGGILTAQLQKLSVELNDQLLLLERLMGSSTTGANNESEISSLTATRKSEEVLDGLCLVTQLMEELQSLETTLSSSGTGSSDLNEADLLLRSAVQSHEGLLLQLLASVRPVRSIIGNESKMNHASSRNFSSGTRYANSNIGGVERQLYTALDPAWEESERVLLAHLQAKEAVQAGQLEEEPPGIDSFLLAQHNIHSSAGSTVATLERDPDTGEVTNILTNMHAGQVQRGVEVRPGFDLVRVGNFSESEEGLQDIAFFHHRLTLDEFTPERERLVRQCCQVLRDVSYVFNYDPAFITLFYEVGATSRFIRQKVMFNLAPVEEHALANGISDVRLDPFCYTYFYGLCVHKLAHFFDVVHGTRHNYFMNEFRCNFVCQWMELLESKGFHDVEALPYAKDHLWKVVF